MILFLFLLLERESMCDGVVEKNAAGYSLRLEYGGDHYLAFPDRKPNETCPVAEFIKKSVGKRIRVFGVMVNGHEYSVGPTIFVRKAESIK